MSSRPILARGAAASGTKQATEERCLGAWAAMTGSLATFGMVVFQWFWAKAQWLEMWR